LRQKANRQFGRDALQEEALMKSPIVKRSIVIGGHKTSVSLEDAFWSGLKEIAHGQHTTLSNTIAEIDRVRLQSNLSSAIRLFVLDRLRAHTTNGSGVRAEADTMIRGSLETHV
jgi:Uncharacterized protein related to arylsulfate sulfotransferase involved in siderophore biosynthesis